ncbi:MAG: NAD(P)H-dependent glycerol-3-phosphate dehydrogenase [Chitinophagaceae bacterium]
MAQSITILGNGSWSTALVKLLTDNALHLNWWMRSTEALQHIEQTGRNPHYLSSIHFDLSLLTLYNDINKAIASADIILVGIPSAFVVEIFQQIPKELLQGKKIISAIKGILPNRAILFNEYLEKEFDFLISNYACISGPCHAEEVATDKLSYLTFASVDEAFSAQCASLFKGTHLHTVTSPDVYGVQYAAVLKNIYALGAGIAHGLDYGDNFLSVYITNCFAELQQFMDVISTESLHHYNTSAYLGDLLVTCYSLHSRNRTFGNFIGKGYSVAATKLELNMVAEGYYASKGIHTICERINYSLPIAHAIYEILWHQRSPVEAFKQIELLFS